MIARTKTISYEARTKILLTFALVSALSVGIYVYAVFATVYHAVAKENLSRERGELSVRVSELEYQDIALRNKVDLGTALARGFFEVTSPLYVSRTEESLTRR